MFVTQLQIRAFRGIESLDLRFQPGVNVVIGVNGIGKSSILDCFATSVFQYTELLIPNREVLFPGNESIRIGYSESSCTISIKVDGGRESSWGWKIIADESKTINIIETRNNQIDQKASTLEDLWKVLVAQKSYREKTSTPCAVYYPAYRHIPQESSLRKSLSQSNLEGFPKSNEQILSNKQINFLEFFAWFKEREDLENEQRLESDPSYRDRQLEAVRNAIPQFLPGFSHLRVRRTNLSITVSKNDQELSINQLSDGEKSLLTMVADIARRLAIHHPGLENPLQGTGVILIDEIDAHLHPQWQRRIVSTLQTTFPNCQFILATHSPFIISDLPPESIHLLSQTADGNVIAQHPNVSLGRDINQILELVMGVPERPDWSGDGLRRLFRLIEDGDLEGARQVKIELEQQMGMNEPDVMKAEAMIRRRELLGK
jgi:predicted ATP-binding protein involved in virulence